MIRLLDSLYAALAPLDPAQPEVGAAIQAAMAELSLEPGLDCLLTARERIWDRVTGASDASNPRGRLDGEA